MKNPKVAPRLAAVREKSRRARQGRSHAGPGDASSDGSGAREPNDSSEHENVSVDGIKARTRLDRPSRKRYAAGGVPTYPGIPKNPGIKMYPGIDLYPQTYGPGGNPRTGSR